MEELEINENHLEEYFSGVIEEYLANADLDVVESLMIESTENLIEFKWVHTFTPRMYIREIFMPAGALLTSRVHNTEHPYAVLEGRAIVALPDGSTEEICAGHSGVTKVGTRRALYIEEDSRWVAYYALTDEEECLRNSGESESNLIKKVEERILFKREHLGSGKTTFELYSDKLKG